MYRPEIKVLDCTIRDGGLMNEWRFDKALVKDVFDGLAKAGLDYVELGYRVDKKMFPPSDFGPLAGIAMKRIFARSPTSATRRFRSCATWAGRITTHSCPPTNRS